MLTLGSLFDGISGFPLAGLMNGIETKWVSEIEPFCIKVSSARFPNAKQLGSVTDINGADIEPVDIITFGSPCQDLSVAGKQLGIHEGQRSNLFFEAIRIIKEMRKADEASGRSGKSIRPRFAVWENVDNARSSNKGEDFKAVLEALAGVRQDGVSIPRPKKWGGAGCVVGDGWSLAWRVYDAQYWGVPQRRKRIYLVADFGSERAVEILSECEGLPWNITESGAAREGTAADAEGGTGRGSGVRCLNPWDSQTKRLYGIDGCYAAIQANSGGGGRMDGVLYEPKSLMEENWAEKETIGALRAEPSKSANCVVEPAAFMGGNGAKARSIAYCDDGSTPTLKSSPSGGNTVPDVCYALQGNYIDRDTKQNGIGWRDGEMYTLDATDRPAVVFPEIARTLAARHDSSPCVDRGQNVVCYGVDCRNATLDKECTHTLQAKANGGISLNCTPSVVYDARGNGDGNIAPTMTGHHNANISDWWRSMNETCIPRDNGRVMREDGQGTIRAGCGERNGLRVQNYTEGGISATLDASYYKGPGARNGKEREFLAMEVKPSAATRNKVLQILRETYGEKAVQEWCIGILELVQQAGILLEGMSDKGDERKAESRDELGSLPSICTSDKGRELLRNLRESRKNRRTPHRHELSEQQPRKFDSALQELPFEATQNAEHLLDLWKKGERVGLLQQALHSFQEIWRPDDNSLSKVAGGKKQRKYIVRRLTPIEAARLQGMPDWWCENLGGSDSAKYKAYGNGLALPCAYDVMNRIARFVEYENAAKPDTND